MRHGRRMRALRVEEIPEAYRPFEWMPAARPQTPDDGPVPFIGEPAFSLRGPRPGPWEFLKTVAGNLAAGQIDFSSAFPFPGPLPIDSRGMVDSVEVWAVDFFGRPVPSWLFVSGDVAITWTIFVDNRPQLILTYPRQAEQIQPRPLLDLGPGQKLSASITLVTDTQFLIAYIGLRVRGRFVPYDLTESGLKEDAQ